MTTPHAIWVVVGCTAQASIDICWMHDEQGAKNRVETFCKAREAFLRRVAEREASGFVLESEEIADLKSAYSQFRHFFYHQVRDDLSLFAHLEW